MSLAWAVSFSTSDFAPQAKNILSPTSASHMLINSFNATSENNFPTGPLAEIILLLFSIVRYANPDAPCSFAHLSIPSKKLLGFSVVFFVLIALTMEPALTNFLKISNLTSSLKNKLVVS